MAHHHHHGRSHLVKYPHAERNADWSFGDFFSDLFGDPQQQQQQQQQKTTVVSVVFVSAKNTFASTVPVEWITPTLSNGAPVQATAKATPKAHSDSHLATASGRTSGEIMATSVHGTATRLNVAASGSPTSVSADAAAATATTTPQAAKQSGLSGGAKAGLALGVLILIGGVLALVLVIYKRKKDKEGSQRIRDDEKEYKPPVPPPNDFYAAAPPPAREPSVRTARTASTAPRLSLRPVTQFSPMLDNRSSPSRPETPSSGPPMTQMNNLSRDNLAVPGAQPQSAWERRGASNAHNSPANPFGDHAETADSPTLPKTGSVASALPTIETNSFASLSAAPVSPISGPPGMSGPAAGAAAGAAVGAGVGAAAVAARRGLPPPIAVNADSAVGQPLPSPANSAWTDDIPASPGPAPAGAPPVAGPAGPNNVHRVQMDFAPSMEDELEIRAGQLVRMLHEYDDGWALCTRLDRSQQGVVPRSCLSKHPVKPRAGPPRGGPPRGPTGPGAPGPLTPNGRNSPPQFPGVPRPLTPNGRNSPGPYANQPRPMSPGGYPMGQPNRPRANSNAPAYGRSMSPGPYGAPGQQPQRPQPDMQGRRRSNSASQILGRRNSPPRSSPLTQYGGGVPRKPVPGQAM